MILCHTQIGRYRAHQGQYIYTYSGTLGSAQETSGVPNVAVKYYLPKGMLRFIGCSQKVQPIKSFHWILQLD